MTVIKTIDASKNPFTLAIGRQLENNYRRIIFDCSGFDTEVETITLVHQRAQDVAPYIVTQATGETSLAWDITSTDTAFDGIGRAELRIYFSNGLAKSAVFKTLVIKSITADTTIPEPLQSWYDAMIAYIDEHSVTDEQLAQAIADYIEEHPIEAPVESVNGKQGVVVLTASDIGALPDSTQIPTRTSQLQNDSGFLTSAPVESVNGQTGAVVITAGGLGAYEKPAAGIPETDLAAAVQASLGKAETALQEAPVQSVNNQTGAVVLDASDVHALPDSTVIPTVPTNVSAFQNDAGYLTAVPSEYVTETEMQTALAPKANTADLATVATSGDYADLSNKPTIPTVPSNVSAFNNDANYITASQAPVQSVNGQTGAVTVTDTNTTYTISISGNVITLTPSSGTAQSITVPTEWTVQNMTSGDTTVTLNANTFYVFPEMSSLAITVSTTGMYAFRFESGATATTLTVTNATMPDSFTVEANKTYEVNVYQGYAVVQSWS